jgi:hypothetical protein
MQCRTSVDSADTNRLRRRCRRPSYPPPRRHRRFLPRLHELPRRPTHLPCSKSLRRRSLRPLRRRSFRWSRPCLLFQRHPRRRPANRCRLHRNGREPPRSTSSTPSHKRVVSSRAAVSNEHTVTPPLEFLFNRARAGWHITWRARPDGTHSRFDRATPMKRLTLPLGRD